MSKQILISAQAANTQVQGVLTVESSRKIMVEITQPYAGVSTFMGLSFLTRMPENKDFRNLAVAKRKGELLLIMLYEGLHHAYQLKACQSIGLEALDARCAEIIGPKTNAKAQLKAAFKQGEVSQKDYQQELAKLKAEQAERSLKVIATNKDYMVRVFGKQFALHPINGWREFLNKL